MRLSLARGALALLASGLLLSCSEMPIAPTRVLDQPLQFAVVPPPQIVISQIYGGGGNSGATLKNDFIELFNPGTDTVDVTGWSVQYASATGSFTNVTAINGKVAPGAYFLVQEAAGAGGTVNLPTPDATGGIAMAGTAGKVLVSRTTAALGIACPSGGNVVNLVSYGSGTNCGTFTATLSNTTAALRGDSGCTFNDDPAVDFTTGTPNPRNSASAKHPCGSTQPVVATVTVAPDTATIYVAATRPFAASARDSAGNVVATTITWSSSNTAVATVDASGTATGVAQGTAQIIATATNGVADSALLTVNNPPPPVIADVVISQIYGGGGNSGAFYRNDYVELFNHGTDPVDLTGWTVSYTSAAGTSWQTTTLSGTIQPHSYYLVQEAAGSGGSASLPTPDATGSIALGATAGKVVLAQPGVTLSGACPGGSGIADHVGYGTNTTANGCESVWGGRTGDLSNTLAAFRKRDGCVSTGSATDFVVQLANPRNGVSPVKNCTQPSRPAASASIVINELMGDPANAESESWGEWFEVHNYGATDVDLQGWTIVTDGTSQPDHTITTSVIVPAGGYAVLGRGGDVLRNGGVDLDYNYFTGNATTIWLDDVDFLMLVDAAGALVDSVAWSSLPHGVTKGLRDSSLPNPDVDGANWGYSLTTFGDGDYGTPDADNDPLGDTAPFVSGNTITVTGRLSTDAPLPVGFEDQLFATERDPSNNVVVTTFTWSSLTPAIASIDDRGVIRALAAGTARFRVVSADGAARNHTLLMEIAVASTTAQYGDNTELGTPTDADPSDDFIIQRAQYTASFNGARGIPNWVAYDLNATHITPGQDRCDCFTFDPELETAGFTRYNTADYTGAGGFAGYAIDRGHMARSFDRTSGTLDNATTFYFSNVVPQAAALNQGPWANLENFLGDKARIDNKEVYIFVGPAGSKGTVKNEGKITIPQFTWKVAVIMDRGEGLSDVHDYRDVEVIAVVAPNDSMINGVSVRNTPWQTFQVTVDSVEALTGYNLLALLPDNIERAVESNTRPPIPITDGPYSGNEGSSISLSGASSVDPNGSIVSYQWDFGDGNAGSGSAVTHTYAQDGSYTVRLIVTDNDALVDTVTTTATIANVAPNIASFGGATLLPGETFSTSGSFSDPGADSWTATVDYGDGSGTSALVLNGQSFWLSHLYSTPGSFTVTVGVSDDDVTSTGTQTVVVLTLLQAVDSAIALVDQLLAAGEITANAANSLKSDLNTARKQIERGKPNSAVSSLQNVLEQLNGLVKSGKLSAQDADPLRTLVTRIIDSIV